MDNRFGLNEERYLRWLLDKYYNARFDAEVNCRRANRTRNPKKSRYAEIAQEAARKEKRYYEMILREVLRKGGQKA